MHIKFQGPFPPPSPRPANAHLSTLWRGPSRAAPAQQGAHKGPLLTGLAPQHLAPTAFVAALAAGSAPAARALADGKQLAHLPPVTA